MSNVEDDNTSSMPDDMMEVIIMSVQQAEGLYANFVKKMQGEGGAVIEDQSIEVFTAQQKATPDQEVESAALFLAAARNNCMLMTRLIHHLQSKSGVTISFDACNLFMQKLNQTVYETATGAGDNSVH